MAGSVGAVVKASYSRGAAAALRLAKGHVRYAVHRCNEHGQRQYREVWDGEGRVGKQGAYARLDRVQPSDYVYRLMLLPNPEHQDTGGHLDLRLWTQRMMAQLEQDVERPVDWFAVSHDNPDHRHVHVVAVTQRRLEVGQFRSMRAAGDSDAAAQQRNRPREPGSRDQQAPTAVPRRDRERDVHALPIRVRGGAPSRDLSRGPG
jgi:hypothetical protein